MNPEIQHFHHEATATFSYVVYDPDRRVAAVVDPVLDFDAASGRTGTGSVEAIIAFLRDQNLQLEWLLETHVHADHLSAASFLRDQIGGKIGIGRGVCDVQETFSELFNLKDLSTTGAQFDHLFADGEAFQIGNIRGEVLATPGHTSDSVSYLIGDAVFVGDTLFAPERGTARTDFPGGSARTLYRSTQLLLALPEDTRVFLCHDYPATGETLQHVHTVKEHREKNVHVGGDVDEGRFVEMRKQRDATLDVPALLIPSVQVNIRAGQMPPPESNGVSYLKTPIDQLKGRS